MQDFGQVPKEDEEACRERGEKLAREEGVKKRHSQKHPAAAETDPGDPPLCDHSLCVVLAQQHTQPKKPISFATKSPAKNVWRGEGRLARTVC